jgi:Right handed beta helix region
VSNGTVRGFDAGVAIVGGELNRVHLLTVRDNIGSLKAIRPAYGDGIVIRSSSSNWILQNTVTNNGPFGGVSVIADATTPSDSNAIDRNTIIDNDVDRAATNEDDGIRIEGPNANGTVIRNNRIIANGRDGIGVFEDVGGTGSPNIGLFVTDNVVHGNGFHGMANRKGDGIVVGDGADSAIIFENEVTGNAANGIRLGSVAGRVVFNDAAGNVLYPGVTGAFDLNDENPDCADNEWEANTFGSASQTCIQ